MGVHLLRMDVFAVLELYMTEDRNSSLEQLVKGENVVVRMVKNTIPVGIWQP